MGKANGLEGRRDVDEILSSVSSDKVDTRTKGLRDLVSIVKEDTRRPRKQQISDKGYHTILENLFRGTKYEIAYHARAKKASGTKAESRLTTCASLIRTIVETQIRKIGSETVKAIVEHVCQSLPTADGNYCEPLVFDYIRILLSILEYKAHVENLLSEEVHDIVTFCLDLVRDLDKVSDEQNGKGSLGIPLSFNSRGSNSMRQSRSATPSVNANHGISFSKDNSQRMTYPQLQSSAAGIVSCLQHLTCMQLTPVLEKADDIFTILFDLLQSHTSISTIQQPAFEAINSLIPRILTSNVQSACNAMRRFIPLVRHFWQVRAAGLKEVLLSVFLHGESLLPLLISTDDTGNCNADLSAVVEVLRQEYLERRQKEWLLIEDVDLSDYTCLSSSQPPLSCKFACVRRGAIKAEEPWSLLRISATIVVILDTDLSPIKEANERDESDHRRSKRQRLTKQLDEILLFIRSARVESKIYGLQILAFIFERQEFNEIELLEILELLGPSLSDENGTIVAWSIFATAWWVYPVKACTQFLTFANLQCIESSIRSQAWAQRGLAPHVAPCLPTNYIFQYLSSRLQHVRSALGHRHY